MVNRNLDKTSLFSENETEVKQDASKTKETIDLFGDAVKRRRSKRKEEMPKSFYQKGKEPDPNRITRVIVYSDDNDDNVGGEHDG